MNYNPDIHHRCSIRLKGYDYSRAGFYFITICTQNWQHLFGEIADGEMILNDAGRIAYNEWVRTPEIRSEIQLGEFVVMPNHFHGIVKICRGDRPVAPALVAPTISPSAPAGPKPKSIGSFMSGFKSSVTKQINRLHNTPGVPVWQRNYYEHIIRNDESYRKIAEYIISNPFNWEEDDYYGQENH